MFIFIQKKQGELRNHEFTRIVLGRGIPIMQTVAHHPRRQIQINLSYLEKNNFERRSLNNILSKQKMNNTSENKSVVMLEQAAWAQSIESLVTVKIANKPDSIRKKTY
jgi:hypothetical protein